MPLLLTEADVRAVLTMPDLIDAMEGAVAAYSAGEVAQPIRTVLEVGADRNYFGLMPAARGTGAFGAKLVTVFHRNHMRGLPSHLASIVVFDPETGALDALVDGRFITEARTAAVSAVSVRHLARADAHVLALLGSGVQAHSHLEALRQVRAIDDVRVWSPTAAHREAFAARASAETGLPVRAVPAADAAVRGADLVVLATASAVPVVSDEALAPGVHVCAVGACRPTQREVPAAFVARARVYVDSRAGALQEAGDLLLAIKDGVFEPGRIAGELGEVVLGRAPGRSGDRDATMFESLGMAAEDIVSAELAVRRARERGLGTTFHLQ